MRKINKTYVESEDRALISINNHLSCALSYFTHLILA